MDSGHYRKKIGIDQSGLSLALEPGLKTVKLIEIAHARSGDKGDGSNIGLIAYDSEGYEILRKEVTADRVKEHFHKICKGTVERFELPNLLALNFILHDSLGGGGTESLKTDAQGKAHAMGLLQMKIEVPDSYSVSRK